MCRELEAVGLQSPEYRLNAFMLQAMIRNRLSLEEKSLFESENHGLVGEKPLFESENHGLVRKKALFEEENQGAVNENHLVEQKARLSEVLESAVTDKTITPTIAKNIKAVLEIFECNQVFGRKEIKNALHYGDYRAGSTIETMHQLKLIEPVKGHGKGKYRINKTVQFR